MAIDAMNLDPDLWKKIDNASRELNTVVATIDAAKRCKIDVSQLEATRNEMVEAVRLLKVNFFDGVSRPGNL